MPPIVKCFLFTLFLVAPASAGASAQTVHFPPPRATASEAADDFDQRSEIVIGHSACGREIQYSTIRREMLDGNYEHQGEGLLGSLVAKTAWLTDPRRAETSCDYKLTVPRPRNPDGSFVHPSADAFLAETMGAWGDPRTPTRCSFDTSAVMATEDEATFNFQVEPACMRLQINEAIRAMIKNAQMGTEKLPCIASFALSNPGDFDVVVRDLVRLFYMGTMPRREVLDQATIDHMYEELLAARGAVSDASYSIISDCDDPAGDELGSPVDFADREYWYNELLDSIGDFLKWLFQFFIKTTALALSSVAGTAGAPFLLAAGEDPIPLALPKTDIRIPETENHRLMIEGSRYLTNAKIIQELHRIGHDNVDEIEEKQEEVRVWLLKTLQTIAIADFDEYNSRPYTRYSLNAILNLYDFAEDPALRTASQIVLDLSAAKFAAASARGRRSVPFRRLADNDVKPLYEMVAGADHEVVRAVVYAGQTQLLGGGIANDGVANMIYAAVSGYRWPRAVLEVAVERFGTFEQDIRHDGIESYYASPGFTMSLGGVPRPSALQALGFERDVDRGVAMPTVIIPVIAGHQPDEIFAVNGNGSQHNRTPNLCGYEGFICGIQPTLPRAFSSCTTGTITSTGPDLFFINTAACQGAAAGPHLYAALMRGQCNGSFCESGRRWGLFEVVEAPAALPSPDPGFDAFRAARQAAFQAALPDSGGFGTYAAASGRSIRFQVADAGSQIVSIDGTPRRGFATRGGVIDAEGDGRTLIKSPWSTAKVVIDFSNWSAPLRDEAP